jgi:hypothetical protein
MAPPRKWTQQVFEMLMDAVCDTIREKLKNHEADKAVDEFLAVDPSKPAYLQDLFRNHDLSRTKVIEHFRNLLEAGKIDEKKRPKLSENTILDKIRESLCQLTKICVDCKQTDHFKIPGTNTCEECYCAKLDKSYHLEKGTALRVWKRSNNVCYYTSIPITLANAHLDHIYPKSRHPQWTSTEKNLCFARDWVNKAKGDMEPDLFLNEFLEASASFIVSISVPQKKIDKLPKLS